MYVFEEVAVKVNVSRPIFLHAMMKSYVEKSLIVPVSTPLESFSSRMRIKFSEVVCKDLTHESYHVPSCLPTIFACS